MRRYPLIPVLLALASLSACTTLERGGGGSATMTDTGPRPAGFTSDDDFRNWFAFYYKEPHPERLTPAIQFMEKSGYLESQPEIASVFLAQLFSREPTQLAKWAAEWEALKPGAWNVVLVSLWFSGTRDTLALLQKNAGRASGPFKGRVQAMLNGKAPAPDLLGMAVTEPRHINILWSAFSASGDVRYVQKVVGYVKLYGDEEDPVASAIGETALMTLATNVPLHDVVASVCMDEDHRNPDEKTRALLDTMFSILAKISKEEQMVPAH